MQASGQDSVLGLATAGRQSAGQSAGQTAGRQSAGLQSAGLQSVDPGRADPPPGGPQPGEPRPTSRSKAVPFVVRYLNILIRLVAALLRIRIRVEGAEHLPDEPGVIIAMNHHSVVDPAFVCVVVERFARRRTRFMAKVEVMQMRILGPVLRAYGVFGVRRGELDREAIRTARAVLRDGDWLGLAPEGTRSRSGVLGEPQPGVALLALRSGALVLPVGISGSDRAWPVGARLPRPLNTVTIRFGPAYRLAEVAVPGSSARGATTAQRREAIAAYSENLMERIAALIEPRYRGRFGSR